MNRASESKSRLRRIGLPVIVLAIAVGIVALMVATRSPPPPTVVDEKAWPVSVEAIELRDLAPSLQLYARAETPTAAELGSSLAADVVEVRVLEGDVVKSGELLVRLDDADYRLRVNGDSTALKHEEELLELARKAQQRAEQMQKEGLASEAAVDDARQVMQQRSLAVATRKLSLDTAKLNLDRTRIHAPFAGRVSRVAVAKGDRANPGMVLVNLYDPSRLELRAPVPSSYLARVQQSLAGAGQLPARIVLGGDSTSATLIRLSGEARAGSSNIDGFFKLDQPRIDLEPGRTLEVILDLPVEQGVVAIPFEALYQRDRVYIVNQDRMKGVKVDILGEHRDGPRARLLVRSPELKDGMRMVTTQLPLAIDGLKIRPQI